MNFSLLVLSIMPLLIFVAIWYHRKKKESASFREVRFTLGLIGVTSWAGFWGMPIWSILISNGAVIGLFISLAGTMLALILLGLVSFAPDGLQRRMELSDLNPAISNMWASMKWRVTVGWQAWAPGGIWSGLSLPKGISFQRVMWTVVIVFAVVATILIHGQIFLSVAAGDDLDSALMRIYVIFGFTTLSVTLFPSILIAWLVLWLLSRMKFLKCEVRMGDFVRTMASWSGSAGAITLYVGLTGFVFYRLGITSSGTSAGGQSSLPFDALIIYPLVGASIGFVLGSLHGLMSTTRNLGNHVIGLIVPPAFLALSVLWMGSYGFTLKQNALSVLDGVTPGESREILNNGQDLLSLVERDPERVLKIIQEQTESIHAIFPDQIIFVVVTLVIGLFWSYLIQRKQVRRSSERKSFEYARTCESPEAS